MRRFGAYVRGKTLRALRRRCWGCDNRVRAAGWWGPCTCSSSTTDRVKEKRLWKREAEREARDE